MESDGQDREVASDIQKIKKYDNHGELLLIISAVCDFKVGKWREKAVNPLAKLYVCHLIKSLNSAC